MTLEGIDGSGKTTAARILEGRLRDRDVLFTAEPTPGEIGRLIRKEHLAQDRGPSRRMEELFLFVADHAQHLYQRIIPALDRGALVISDRYTDSRVAYQGVTLQDILPEPIQWIRELHRPWSVDPHLTILFRLDPALAVERCRTRPRERFEHEAILTQVARIFDRLAQEEPRRFLVIDAEAEGEEVAERALSAILELAASRISL